MPTDIIPKQINKIGKIARLLIIKWKAQVPSELNWTERFIKEHNKNGS